MSDEPLKFYCDEARHLICLPYSKKNLIKMARILSLSAGWYHGGRHPHYDIPKTRIDEIKSKCVATLSSREILQLITAGIVRSKDASA